MIDKLNVVYNGRIWNMRAERKDARFVVIKDKWANGDYYLNVYDNRDYMVVGYYEYDDLSTAKEVCDYCNRLNDELVAAESGLDSFKFLNATGKPELLDRINSLEKELVIVKGKADIESRYCREVLLDCLESYPGDKGLLDFKNTMGW